VHRGDRGNGRGGFGAPQVSLGALGGPGAEVAAAGGPGIRARRLRPAVPRLRARALAGAVDPGHRPRGGGHPHLSARQPPRAEPRAASAPRERFAEAFVFHRGMDHAGAALGPLCAAALLLLWPEDVRRVFLVAAIPGTLALLALFSVREEPAAPDPPTRPLGE